MFEKINEIKKSAEAIRKKGRNGDTILAHINPEEAKILKMFGGSGRKNPKTGLPEFGKPFKKAFKIMPRVIGTVGGMMFGGPAGAIVGGGLGGSMERGGKNKFKGFMSGAGTGALYTAAAPWAANGIGIDPNTMMGKMAGLNHPSFFGQLGIPGAPMSGGGIGLFGNGAGNMGLLQKGAFLTKGLGGLADMFGHKKQEYDDYDDYIVPGDSNSYIDEGYGGHDSDYMAPMRKSLPENSMPTLFGLGSGNVGGLGYVSSGFLKKRNRKNTKNNRMERFE